MLSRAGALWMIRREALEAWLVLADVVLIAIEVTADGGRNSLDEPLTDVCWPARSYRVSSCHDRVRSMMDTQGRTPRVSDWKIRGERRKI